MGERLLDTQKVGSSILLPPTSGIKPSGDRVKCPEGFLVPGTHLSLAPALKHYQSYQTNDALIFPLDRYKCLLLFSFLRPRELLDSPQVFTLLKPILCQKCAAGNEGLRLLYPVFFAALKLRLRLSGHMPGTKLPVAGWPRSKREVPVYRYLQNREPVSAAPGPDGGYWKG